MYNIIINEEIVETVMLPCYVFYDPVLDSWCTCDYELAEAILVNPKQEGEEPVASFYADLAEKKLRHEGFPVAIVIKVTV